MTTDSTTAGAGADGSSSTVAPDARPAATRPWPRIDRHHVAALVCLALFAWLYLHRLTDWRISDDEEGYLYAAWRISLGELPYRDFLTPQLPAFLFPGAAIVRGFGPDVWALRAWSTAQILVTGLATYLTGRRLFGPLAGLAALVVVVAMNDIYALGRAFRPEATMLALGSLALYAFVRADGDRRRRGYALASLLFGGALLAKLFGLLPWAATLACVGAEVLRGERTWRGASADLAALALPGAALVLGVMGAFRLATPETYTAVLGHHLMQGGGLTAAEVLRKNLDFFGRVVVWHASLLAWIPLGLVAIHRLAPRRGWVVAWHIPTLAAFLFLSRELWSRHLAYVLPALALVFGAAVAWIAGALAAERRLVRLAAATLVAFVAIPYLLDDIEAFEDGAREIGTARLASLVSAFVPEGSRVLADTAGPAFYGRRATTYFGAGMSEGAAESGQITGAALLGELAAGDVPLVLADRLSQGGPLPDLHDYDAFMAALAREYGDLGSFYRHYQKLSVFVRLDVPLLDVDFGWGRIVALDAGARRVEAGSSLTVTPVFAVGAPAERRLTAFLHLVAPDGTTWGQGDGMLDNALYRGTDEWEPGEVVPTPLELAVEPGTPPGRYRLRLGVYDVGTGERSTWRAGDGSAGDSWDAGEVEVTVPDRPPEGDAESIRSRLLAGDAAGRGGAGASEAADLPDASDPVPATGPYRLLVARRPMTTTAGFEVPLRLTWRAADAPGADHRVRVAWTEAGDASGTPVEAPAGTDGATAGSTTLDPGATGWPTGAWRAGEVAATVGSIVVDPATAAPVVSLTVEWIDAAGTPVGPPIALGRLAVTPLPPVESTNPPIPRPLDARVGDAVDVLGSDLPASAPPGGMLDLTVFWRSRGGASARPYSVLVHVVPLDAPDGVPADETAEGADDPSGPPPAADIVAQADGPPAGGARPTTSWRPGEVIADPRSIQLPDDLATGRYAVLVGLYRSDERLPAVVDGRAVPDGRVMLGAFDVRP